MCAPNRAALLHRSPQLPQSPCSCFSQSPAHQIRLQLRISANRRRSHASNKSPKRPQSVAAQFAAIDHRYRASSHQILHSRLQLVRRSIGTLSGFATLKVGHPNSNRYSAWYLWRCYADGRLGLNLLVPSSTLDDHSPHLTPLRPLCSTRFAHSFLPQSLLRWPPSMYSVIS